MDFQLNGKLVLVAFVASPLSSATNGAALRVVSPHCKGHHLVVDHSHRSGFLMAALPR